MSPLQVSWVEGMLWDLSPDIRRTYTYGKNLEWHVDKKQTLPEMMGLGIAASVTGKVTYGPGNQKGRGL